MAFSAPPPDGKYERNREIGSIASRGSRLRVRPFDLREAGVVKMPAGGRGASPSLSTLRFSRSPDRLVVRRWRPAGSSAGPACEPSSPPFAAASASPRFRRANPPAARAAVPLPPLLPPPPPPPPHAT